MHCPKTGIVLGLISMWIHPHGSFGQAVENDRSPDIPKTQEQASMSESPPNLATPTAGGLQFWTDYRIRLGYRLQKNTVTGHWRTLDPSGRRQAWGSRKHCLARLDQLKTWSEQDDDGRTVTILLHGLMRTAHCVKPLQQRLDPTGKGHTIRFGYASTRAEVPDHAAAFIEVIDDLPKSWKFRFVGHSMGNIVVRYAIGRAEKKREVTPTAGDWLSRSESMVMLGPPNQGSLIAKRMEKTGLFGVIAGSGGRNMGPTFDKIKDDLATPPFPFAIVAGDIGHWVVGNPLLDGPNDLLVTVEETKLKGMTEHHIVPVPHATLMKDPRALQHVDRFFNRDQ